MFVHTEEVAFENCLRKTREEGGLGELTEGQVVCGSHSECVSRGAQEGARAQIRVWRGELGQRARGRVAAQVRVIAQLECGGG